MRLSRANMPLASEDRTHSQAISPSLHYNLAPHLRLGFINLQHFCHSRWRNPVRLSKSGISYFALAKRYHPDRNPQGAELMANINAARAAILDSYRSSAP